jgi:peptidoglycan hydrolase-like protein with peptidoglycan-binding domain
MFFMSRESILATAAAENGTKEFPAGSNKTEYGQWYGLDGVKWCAIFVSYIYYHAGNPLEQVDSVHGYQSCQSGYNYWKRIGRLTKDPQPADIVLYDWDGDGICDHTGIFVGWVDAAKTKFEAWEGNTTQGNDSDGGEVMLQTRHKSMVRAFASPLALKDGSPLNNNDILERGDSGTDVVVLQKMLFDLHFKITVDGDFGPETESVVRLFQQKHHLVVTGKVTTELLGVIQEEVNHPRISESKFTTGSYLHNGDAGSAVLAIQKTLNIKGADPKLEENGVFDKVTLSAVKEFQEQHGLEVDGIVGPLTFMALGISNTVAMVV